MNRMPTEEMLDPQQKEFLKKLKEKNYVGFNSWIKGFPGSGKSVLLVYAVKRLLAEKAKKGAKIVVVVFTHSLVELCKLELAELQLDGIEVLTMYQFYKSTKKWDYILCDEVQDLTPRILQAMKQRAKSMLIVAGDTNQSIYDRDPQFGEAVLTPEETSQIVRGEDFSLLYIHRLSPSIIRAVQYMMPQMRIFEARRDLTKKDVQIRVCRAVSEEREVEWVYQDARRRLKTGSCSILFPTQEAIVSFCNKILELKRKTAWERINDLYYKPWFYKLNRYLAECQIPIECIVGEYGSLNSAEKGQRIVLMTYHGSKGLDFDNVFIPFANSSFDNLVASNLFMVAMTRSKLNLFITYAGTPLKYIPMFSSDESICASMDLKLECRKSNVEIEF
ncbi:UvrD-helicase domain-containing protein [Bacteroides eggerthii]|jgi:superfamily I DNA/RNA helicase|uniref:DNA 3'-5' helicase II n=1 Tax=Bacteroides eggerthii TaxID=28111 RepID=A0A380YQI3_9BACE|nr:UvrD-helicase domain-containing protein [Bacteroides eggerthii]EEC53907.1 hypothetical protein BACEGG_01883 [Bacteroides eggerthii DSM 20697]QRQ50151.1 AAA family ATPase [Bacteroides eggerthii]UWN87490.1 AAA family ATPase [Bacteroides eggerthii]SUV29931.1 Superfamily I DNA and RNA helicases [Bacteroides eggerthii]